MPEITVPMSAAMIKNVQQDSIWLDAEAQAELGSVRVEGCRLIGEAGALLFVAENAEDFAQESGLRGSRLDSLTAIAARIRFALAHPGVEYRSGRAA